MSDTENYTTLGKPEYLHTSLENEDAKRLREILLAKTWIGFDLDDTLHEFRRSSGRATQAVLEMISRQYGHSMATLQSEYSKVLKVKTANAFADYKTSFEYRRERFCTLLERCSLPQEDWLLSDLLDLYEITLIQSFELKTGAREVLQTVKSLGKKVVIITEGPQDAQERTIEALGIGRYVGLLATTNRFGVAKTQGLFRMVLSHLEIDSAELAYVGDSADRDMRPAMEEGIFSIHLDESQVTSFDSDPPRLSGLMNLKSMLDSGALR